MHTCCLYRCMPLLDPITLEEILLVIKGSKTVKTPGWMASLTFSIKQFQLITNMKSLFRSLQIWNSTEENLLVVNIALRHKKTQVLIINNYNYQKIPIKALVSSFNPLLPRFIHSDQVRLILVWPTQNMVGKVNSRLLSIDANKAFHRVLISVFCL